MIKKAATYLGVAVVLCLAVVGALSLLPDRDTVVTSTPSLSGIDTSGSTETSGSADSSATTERPDGTDATDAASSTSVPEATTTSSDPGAVAAAAIEDSGATKLATLIMSRTILGLPNAGRCPDFALDSTIYPDSVPLLEIADHLTSIGIVATNTIVPGWTDETEPSCINSASLVGSWETSAFLRDVHGWTAVPHGTNKVNLAQITDPDELFNETCGSIPLLEEQGHTDASSFFNFPGNRRSDEAEEVVATCFSFGRRYTGPQANSFDEVRSGDLIKTYSVAGGTCLGCERTHDGDYKHPQDIVNGVVGDPTQDTWGLVLFYKLVVGSKDAGHQQWDCTSPNPAEHWTNQGEIYCWDDFVWVMDQLNIAGVDWVTPADVVDGAVPDQS